MLRSQLYLTWHGLIVITYERHPTGGEIFESRINLNLDGECLTNVQVALSSCANVNELRVWL
jgi:hypothetical protein